MSAKLTPSAVAASSVTPPQPPALKATAIRTCESHSLAIHGCPVKVKENGSVVGTAPCARIQLPTAMCQ